jgi:hypothetical protein
MSISNGTTKRLSGTAITCIGKHFAAYFDLLGSIYMVFGFKAF